MGGNSNKRYLGMIATSNSWRRFWLEWRWRAYPVMRDNRAHGQGHSAKAAQ